MHPQKKTYPMQSEVENNNKQKEKMQYQGDLQGLSLLLSSDIKVDSLRDDQLNRYEKILMEASQQMFSSRNKRILQSMVQSEKRHREEKEKYNRIIDTIEQIKTSVKQINSTIQNTVTEAFEKSKNERNKSNNVQEHVQHIQKQLRKKQRKRISNFLYSIKNFFGFSHTSYLQSSQQQVDTSLLSPLITNPSQSLLRQPLQQQPQSNFLLRSSTKNAQCPPFQSAGYLTAPAVVLRTKQQQDIFRIRNSGKISNEMLVEGAPNPPIQRKLVRQISGDEEESQNRIQLLGNKAEQVPKKSSKPASISKLMIQEIP